jgi:isocitrate dehydrogenase (NAD+)
LDKGIDWTFFRENTEGAYAVGSQGINVTDDLAIDFAVTTSEEPTESHVLRLSLQKKQKKNGFRLKQKQMS